MIKLVVTPNEFGWRKIKDFIETARNNGLAFSSTVRTVLHSTEITFVFDDSQEQGKEFIDYMRENNIGVIKEVNHVSSDLIHSKALTRGRLKQNEIEDIHDASQTVINNSNRDTIKARIKENKLNKLPDEVLDELDFGDLVTHYDEIQNRLNFIAGYLQSKGKRIDDEEAFNIANSHSTEELSRR